MRVVRMGCTINQMGPRMVCLYTVMTSRLTNMRSRSRYCQISLKLMSKAWRLGRMMRSKLSTNLSTNYTNLHELFIALIDPRITRITRIARIVEGVGCVWVTVWWCLGLGTPPARESQLLLTKALQK